MIGIEYAKALIETHPNKDKALEEFNVLISFYDDLSPIMKSPGISYNEKHEIIKKSLKGFSEEFIYFIYVIIDNNRFSNLFEIHKEFKKLYDKSNNVATCDVYTNNKLKESEKKEIIKYLEKTLNKTIEINEIIDNEIKGIKLICDGKTLDYSLTSRINNMRYSL